MRALYGHPGGEQVFVRTEVALAAGSRARQGRNLDSRNRRPLTPRPAWAAGLARWLAGSPPDMPTIVTVSPPSHTAGVEVTDRAHGERSVRPMEDVEAEMRGAT